MSKKNLVSVIAGIVYGIIFIFGCLVGPVDYRKVIATNEIQPEFGKAYSITLNLPNNRFYLYQNDSLDGAKSNLILFENGHEIGVPHAIHQQIRDIGSGLYNHWEKILLFSSADGSDPRFNGKSYSFMARSTPSILMILISLSSQLIFFLFSKIFKFKVNFIIVFGVVLIICSISFASGYFGIYSLTELPERKDIDLVLECLLHSMLGLLLTVSIYLIGINISSMAWINYHQNIYGKLILGYVPGMIMLLIVSLFGINFPHLKIISLIVWSIFVIRGLLITTSIAEGKIILTTIFNLLIPSLLFGVWMSLLWHGPTFTLNGRPSGDLVTYGAMISEVSHYPFFLPNLGNEGEYFGIPLNQYWSFCGAWLSKFFDLDPIIFVAGGGGAAALMSAGVSFALIFSSGQIQKNWSSLALLSISGMAIGRYPYWYVESVPVIHLIPVTTSVWFLLNQTINVNNREITSILNAAAGSFLSKIFIFAVLGPLSFASFLLAAGKKLKFRPIENISVFFILSVVAYFVAKYAPLMISIDKMGLDSVKLFDQNKLIQSICYILRDISGCILIIISFYVLRRAHFYCILPGVLLGLFYPSLARSALFSAEFFIIFSLVALKNSGKLIRICFISVLISLPAMVVGDPAGLSSGFVWVVFSFIVYILSMHSIIKNLEFIRSTNIILISMSSLYISSFIILLGIGYGNLRISSGWDVGDLSLSPDIRDIWRKVPEIVPQNYLGFTDQTSTDMSLLGGWNMYSFFGERQLYITNGYQGSKLAREPEKFSSKVLENNQVLIGTKSPESLNFVNSYRGYFAVVQEHKKMGDKWRMIYKNKTQSIYLYQ